MTKTHRLSGLLLIAVLLSACGGAPDDRDRAAECSPDFTACRATAQSLSVCINGDCSCMPPVHAGENTPVSCHTGEPDSFSEQPAASKN